MRTILSLSFLLLFTYSLSAQSWWGKGVKGEGPVVTRDLEVDPFEQIKLTGSDKLILTQGSEQSVKVEGQANILDLIETEVDGKMWKIKFKEQIGKHEPLTFYVTVPRLSAALLSGSGEIEGTNTFDQSDRMEVGISGSGNLKMDIRTTDLQAGISGSGDIRLTGESEQLELKISGSGDIDAYEHLSENVAIRISGSGDCKIHASENLDAKVSGSGDIYYRGRPRVQTKISGSGDLISREPGGR